MGFSLYRTVFSPLKKMNYKKLYLKEKGKKKKLVINVEITKLTIILLLIIAANITMLVFNNKQLKESRELTNDLQKLKGEENNNRESFFGNLTFDSFTTTGIIRFRNITYLNKTYRNITIFSENKTLINKVISYLSIEEDLPSDISIYIDDTYFCDGRVIENDTIIKITLCDENWTYRGMFVPTKSWIPFVLFHELSHIRYNTTNEGQYLADEYAYRMTKKLGFEVQSNTTKYFEELQSIKPSG